MSWCAGVVTVTERRDRVEADAGTASECRDHGRGSIYDPASPGDVGARVRRCAHADDRALAEVVLADGAVAVVLSERAPNGFLDPCWSMPVRGEADRWWRIGMARLLAPGGCG